MEAKSPEDITLGSKCLFKPDMKQLEKALEEGLHCNYQDVNVEVVDCPDLTKDPFCLAAPGLCGNPKILDIGGNSYLIPVPDKSRIYNLKDLLKLVGLNSGLMIGGGVGPFPFAKTNCEGMFNLFIKEGGCVEQRSIVASIQCGKPFQQALPTSELRCAILANLFVCEGKPGKVLKIFVKSRTGNESFPESIRKALITMFPDKVIGLGGAFYTRAGIVRHHIAPDFSPNPLKDHQDVADWLTYIDIPAPLISTGVLLTDSFPAMECRMQHFHSFGEKGCGHYHIDVQKPQFIEYEGYFTVANTIYRIDQTPYSDVKANPNVVFGIGEDGVVPEPKNP